MPRTLRLDFPGARHHVMNRGARRDTIFRSIEDCILFLNVLADLPERFDVRVHGWALMPNHYHLLLETPRGNLSAAMKHVGAEHTRRLNRREGWDGPVFRGRFLNRVVDSDRYWAYLLLYLHLNPVRAHLVRDPGEGFWTSHAAYAGTTRAPEWLTTEPLLALFGGREGYLAALEAVRVGRAQPPEGFDPDALWRPARTAVTPTPPPPPKADIEAELARVAAACGVTVADLETPRRGRGDNRARWTAAWWLSARAHLPQTEIARRLGAVSEQVCRWAKLAGQRRFDDPQMAGWVAVLEGREVPVATGESAARSE